MKKTLLLIAIVFVCSCSKKDEPTPQSSKPVVYGCMNTAASNYNPNATSDACSCPCEFRPW